MAECMALCQAVLPQSAARGSDKGSHETAKNVGIPYEVGGLTTPSPHRQRNYSILCNNASGP